MADFPLTSLSWQNFEELCSAICTDYLGTGTLTFADGRDKGRDAYFRGTAQRFPSTTAPWSGNFIIQCKHTNKHDASCADSAFKETILNKEIAKLKSNIAGGEQIDNYIIFTNRSLPGTIYQTLIDKISNQTSIQNVEIIGREYLNSMLSANEPIITRFGINKFREPIRFDSDDIKELITIFSDINRSGILSERNLSLDTSRASVYNLEKEKKNRINNVDQESFQFMLEHSLPYFETIESFLKNPINDDYSLMYENTVSDIKAKLIVDRSRFPRLPEAFEYIYDYIYRTHKSTLKKDRRVIRVFIHFMYFNCDIGITR